MTIEQEIAAKREHIRELKQQIRDAASQRVNEQSAASREARLDNLTVEEARLEEELRSIQEQAGQARVGTPQPVADTPIPGSVEPGAPLPEFEVAGNEPLAREHLEGMTVEKLQEELRKRDLPVSGNKDDLIERLEQGSN